MAFLMAIEIIVLAFCASDIVLAIVLYQLIVSQSRQKESYELNQHITQSIDDVKSQVTFVSSVPSRPISIDAQSINSE